MYALILIAFLFFGSGGVHGQAKQAGPKSFNVSQVKPESVGFSSERLARLHDLMQGSVDRKEIPGIVTVLARHGKVIDYRSYGRRDIESGAPMTKDTIFRDFSMTKPVTAVAMMILYEQGKWLPTDTIAKHIPEFSQLKVFKGLDANGQMILEDPVHPPTMQELMTHTAGFSYGFLGDGPVDRMYQQAGVLESSSLQAMIDKVAKLPLLYQPGTRWVYSASMDIQGYIIEKLSGQRLPEFMQQHIFGPLGMKDTGFFVPADKRSRFAMLYRGDNQGHLVADQSIGPNGGDYSRPPALPSGGGGLVSTPEDYLRFAQMLANRGQLDGVRILSPAAVKLMSSNHLGSRLLSGEFGIGFHFMRPGFGYGYNCAVVFNPAEANLPDGQGTFFWDGGAGTWFWVDPANDIVFVGMVQRMVDNGAPNLQYLSRSAVYQALVDPGM